MRGERDRQRRGAKAASAEPVARRLPNVLHLILAANLVLGVLQLGMGWQVAIDSRGAALPLGGVSLQSLAAGEVWGLLTSLFVHTGAAHLLVNVLFIAYFGRTMLSLLGTGGFLKLYFGSGLVGAALQMLVQAMVLGDNATPVMGASACACGLMMASATMLPEEQLSEWFYSILPIHLSQRRLVTWLGLGTLVMGVSALISPWAAEHWGGNAYFAHLGGMATGYYLVKLLGLGERPMTYSTLIQERRWSTHTPEPLPVARLSYKARLEAVTPEMDDAAILRQQRNPLRPSPPVVQEVDAILEKISLHGMASLSEDERQQLERASRELAHTPRPKPTRRG